GRPQKDVSLAPRSPSFRLPGNPTTGLEPHVLKRLGCPPVEPRRRAVVASLRREVALRNPDGRTMACRSKLLKVAIGCVKDPLSLVEASLLKQRAAERELGHTDLGELIAPIAHERKRFVRLGLGLVGLASAEVDLRERADDVCDVDVASLVEEDAQRVLEVFDCPVGLSEEIGQPAEVVQEPPDVDAI